MIIQPHGGKNSSEHAESAGALWHHSSRHQRRRRHRRRLQKSDGKQVMIPAGEPSKALLSELWKELWWELW